MAKLLEFPSFKDARGKLTVIEKILPFAIRRVFYIYDTNEQTRGEHGHRVGQQALICLHKSCKVQVRAPKEQQALEFTLSSPERGLLIEPQEWHSLKFEPGSILLVLASNDYDPDNYL